MIIDSHFHLVDEGWHDMSVFVGQAKVVTSMVGKYTGDYANPVELVKNLLPILSDKTGEKLVASMSDAGVDRTCIFAHDTGLLAGEPAVPIEEQNKLVAEAAARFPDRLISFFSIDPRRKGALELFKRSVEDWGMKGLKFHPTSGFHPYDEVCYPFYERCVEYKMPVLLHTGSQPAPLKGRFTQPIHLDDVAADFPELPIIMAHVAHQLWEEALMIGGIKPNIYYDFSGWQLFMNTHPGDFYRMLRRVIDDVGPWRVFFGSDGPYLNFVYPLDKWVKAVQQPDVTVCPDVCFADEEKEIIMGRAFARLMGI
ncbi:MAG TPA: amidohydrolase family protein [Candidatus Anoxymicrobiaceae bacterium]